MKHNILQERISIECCKTRTEVIKTANQSEGKNQKDNDEKYTQANCLKRY